MKKNDPVLWNGRPGKLFSDVNDRSYAIIVLDSATHVLWFVSLSELTFVKGDEA